MSPAFSTLEFVKKNFDESVEEKLKDTVLVNSNPTIDYILGARLEKLFYKHIPV